MHKVDEKKNVPPAVRQQEERSFYRRKQLRSKAGIVFFSSFLETFF